MYHVDWLMIILIGHSMHLLNAFCHMRKQPLIKLQFISFGQGILQGRSQQKKLLAPLHLELFWIIVYHVDGPSIVL